MSDPIEDVLSMCRKFGSLWDEAVCELLAAVVIIGSLGPVDDCRDSEFSVWSRVSAEIIGSLAPVDDCCDSEFSVSVCGSAEFSGHSSEMFSTCSCLKWSLHGFKTSYYKIFYRVYSCTLVYLLIYTVKCVLYTICNQRSPSFMCPNDKWKIISFLLKDHLS